MEKEKYLTPKMVSDMLHIGIGKTYKLFKLRGFPAIRISNQWLVSDSELSKYLNEHKGSGIVL